VAIFGKLYFGIVVGEVLSSYHLLKIMQKKSKKKKQKGFINNIEL